MTLFGMNEKKKRGIVVPVMALAVCAVAMVGLGFALETSVTSGTNDLEKLMIDLDDNYDDINIQTSPDEDDVNSLFDYEITTEKTTTSSNPATTTLKCTMSSGWSYVKVFGNISGFTLSAKMSFPNATLPVTTTDIVLGLYATDSSGDIDGNRLAKAILNGTITDAFFSLENGTYYTNMVANNVYVIKIDEITISGITYKNDTVTKVVYTSGSGCMVYYGEEDSGNAVSGFPKFDNTGSISFGFTASYQRD